MPYAVTGGASLLGRLMFHAREVQRGKRKPLSFALLWDLPVALAMGWIAYGVCIWAELAVPPTISASIAAGYLGPFVIDRMLSKATDRWFGDGK